ncbi:MAG: hypothetical protein GYA24_17750 [Candidatus Lokiarchaeota archaeon]|nr:hypothetical protein [Candidatus Lokiarchaeota archaeon]
MQVAFGKVDITPPGIREKGEAARVPMAGYSRPHFARGVLDPMMVRAVLIEDTILGNIRKRLLILAIDTLKIPLKFADYIKEKIQKHFGINPNQIVVHATHTHAAPDLTGEYYWPGGVFSIMRGIMFGLNRNDKYMVFITRRIVEMVGHMLAGLVPCKMAFTKTIVPDAIIINRRHPTRQSKSPLGIIAFKHAGTGELAGMLVNFTSHSTTLSNMNDKLSGDFPGRMMDHVGELTSGKVHAVFLGGASGDINPITTCGTDYEHLSVNTILGQKGTAEHMTRMGNFVAKKALEVARSIPDDRFHEHVEYKSWVRTIWVPLRDFTHYHSASPLKATLVKVQNRVVYIVKKYFLLPVVLAIAGNEEQKPNFPGLAIKHSGTRMNCYSKIQYLRFTLSTGHDKKDEFSIIAVPGEPFEDIGNWLLARSHTPPEKTIIVQHANDWFAYFFDLNEYTDMGGMEPLEGTTPVAGYYIKKEFARFLEDIAAGLTAGNS